MPPLRQGRARGAAARPSPYRGGWLSQRCRSSGGDHDTGEYDANRMSLTDDALAATFTRLPNTADVVCCAATCRRWASVVAKEADALSRALPLLPGRALGFFHQYSTPPCFVPTAFGSRLLGYDLPSTSALPSGVQTDALGLLDLSLSCPVASRNGRLVLELQSMEHVNDGKLNLCVCNPMTGDGGRAAASIWQRRAQDGIVLHAVAYWPLRRTTLAVRLDTPQPTQVRMPPDGIINTIQQFRLLGVTPERKLCFIDAADSSGYVGLASMVFETTGDDMCGGAGEWPVGSHN
uniref:F-box domain-containing protein n=1 Tax=Oryza meridionalis TaxID=40149 RepID=A0A0E0C7S5_9ORYZ